MAIDKIVAEYRLEIDGLRQDVAEIKRNLSTVDDSIKKSTEQTSAQLDSIGKQASGKLSAAFNTLGKTIIAAFAVERLGAFLTSTIQLAKEAEEVKAAFDKLNNPALLSQLRKATEGTLSDLKLMGLALKADKLQVPMARFADILKFAKLRADELGGSTESLVETLVQGIGTKSTRALVAVGISQEQFGEEVKKTGDYFLALDSIINKTLTDAGEGFESAADKTDKLRANIENTKVEIGNGLLPVVSEILDVTNKWVKGMSLIPTYFKLLFDMDGDFARLIDNNKKAKEEFEKYTEGVKQFTTDSDIKAYTASFTGALKNQAEELRQNALFASATVKVTTDEQIKAINTLIGFIENYQDTLLKGQDVTEETTKLEKAQTEELKKRIPLFQFLLGVAQDTALPIETTSLSVDELADALLSAADKGVKLKDSLGVVNGELVNTDDEVEKATAAWDDYANALLSIFDSINTAYTNGSNYRIGLLENELEQGAITQMEFDKKKKDIMRAEAKREKAFSILSITLSTARAIMSALATIPPNPALALLAGVTGAVQLGVAAAAPLPFKDGVIDLKGKGTGTSDSNLALLSKGESVMTAKETQKYRPVLEAIRKDKFDEYILKTYVKQIKEKKKDEAMAWDDIRLLSAMNKSIYSQMEGAKMIVGAIREQRKEHRWKH